MDNDQILKLFKLDMGIMTDKRDYYFSELIQAARKELTDKGISLKDEAVGDMMLISDYAAWIYRKRQEDTQLSRNLQMRIRNRIVKARARDVATQEPSVVG